MLAIISRVKTNKKFVAQIVFKTPGFFTAYTGTPVESPIVISSRLIRAFFNTVSADVLIKTTAEISGSFVTNFDGPVVKTPSNIISYVETANPNQIKELKLKIGTLSTDADYLLLNVPDATGYYDPANPLNNPGGYNVLPAPYNQYRPYRENVRLWTVYRIWDVYKDQIQFPETQPDQDEEPYNFGLTFPTKLNAAGEEEIIRGIYEIILIAAPYFNEKLSGGSYDDDDTGSYNIVNGLEGIDFNILVPDDYLYCVNPATGALEKIEQVDKVFTSTRLNLKDLQEFNASEGNRLYGYATEIQDMANANGLVSNVDPYTEVAYSALTSLNAGFVSTSFAYDQYVYYKDNTTKEFVLTGKVLEVVSETVLNVKDLTGNIPGNFDFIMYSWTEVTDFVYSGGTFLSASGTTVLGTDTEFTKYQVGQYLYYSDKDYAETALIGIIDEIVSDTEITLAAPVFLSITVGSQLYASNSSTVFLGTSFGQITSLGSEQSCYVFQGFSTEFTTQFNVGDSIYVVSNTYGEDQYKYNLLGQADSIPTDTVMLFYNPNDIPIEPGDWIWGNPNVLNFKDVDGRFKDFENGTYYSVIGSGTNFVNNFTKGQYIFYLESPANVYINIGQIFEIYSPTVVWMLDPIAGNPQTADILVSSWTLNTETANYADYKGKQNIVEIATEFPGWYYDKVGIMIDDNVINCINRKRYEFLQQVMCGKCNQDYLDFYAIYVAMLSAIEITEWDTAIEFYEKLKQICLEDSDVSCGC